MGTTDVSILFVEDDVQIQKEVVPFLKNSFFSNVYIASNGKMGLEKFHKYLPDIVLTDLRMPLMDGLEMAKEIKRSHQELPIILITSQFRKKVTEAAVDIGIDSYLFKPISLSRLKIILQKYKDQIIQKRAFENEHKLLAEYKGAIDVSALVTKTDGNGVITYANNAFCNMTGYKREELLGKRHNIVKHLSTSPEIHADIWKTIKNKKVWQGRMKNRKKDGNTYYEYTVIVPIVDDHDKIIEFIAMRQDITDLYHKEQDLKKRIKEEVEKNLLETKFSTIGRMAAGITHEINTPLTYIRGNLELMLEDINNLEPSIQEKEYLQEDIQVVLGGVDRIASIVESMREIASSTKEIAKENNVYASLITALTLAYNKSKHITAIHIQNELFTIGMEREKFQFMALTQKQRIEQVWIIILNNALDALKHIDTFEKRLIDINIKNEEKYIVVTIKDNADGIKESILEKIFDPFESTKEEGGIGIGLNIAKRIIDDHKGKIIASNYENGAQFEVYLPRVCEK